MSNQIKFYATEEVAAWLRQQGPRQMSATINRIVTAHIHDPQPSPVVEALHEIRDALAGMTVLTAATPAPTAAEENSAVAEKMIEMF